MPVIERIDTVETGIVPQQLMEEIVALSAADEWDDAKREWELADVFFSDRETPGTCLCGHYPIIEHCVLKNRETGNTAVVGNVCVHQFIGLPSHKLFAALARVMATPEAALNLETIQHAFGKGWVNGWERGFYISTLRKRRLSLKQRAKRVQINNAVLSRVRRTAWEAA